MSCPVSRGSAANAGNATLPGCDRMSPKATRNLPSSSMARLLNLAKQTGDNYQVLLTKFVSERFLYCLGRSSLRDRFVLKGAMLLRLWSDQPYRATRDLDLLRRGKESMEAIRADIDAICATKVDVDGIEFDRKSIRLEAIRPEDEYAGTRVSLIAQERSGSTRPEWKPSPAGCQSATTATPSPFFCRIKSRIDLTDNGNPGNNLSCQISIALKRIRRIKKILKWNPFRPMKIEEIRVSIILRY
jgi:hypothetical protein